MMPNMASFIFAPIFNSLADQYDMKFEMMGASLLGNIALIVPLLYTGNYEIIALVLNGGSSIIGAPMGSLVDSMVISNLNDPGDFGKMRQWGAISFGIFSFLGGVSITTDSGGVAETSQFVYIMAMMAVMGLLTFYILLRVRTFLTMKEEEGQGQGQQPRIESALDDGIDGETGAAGGGKQGTVSAVVQLFAQRPVILVFCMVVFCSGFGAGVIDSFLFVHLEELGGSGTLCGIARFITCMAEVPAFQVAGTLHKRFGTWPLLAFTQAVFVLRFVCYSSLRNPWLVLPVEILNGVTFAITWSVSCIYADAVAPPGTHATMQALLEAMHFGLGCGVGSLTGGFIYEGYGAIKCFRWSGCLSAFSCLVALVTAAQGDNGDAESSGGATGDAIQRQRRPSETALNRDVELTGVNSKHGLLVKTEDFEC
jgi:predicted MFS family arabinose efflux permease